MAISTSKPEIYAEGATDISWTRLQSNPLLQGANNLTNIRFGQYKRNPNDTSETPLIPDAEENADIATEESGNLRVGAFRGAIKRHDVTFDDASDYENVEFNKYFGANLVKNVPKNLNVDGIIYSHDVDEPAAKIDTIDYSNDSVRNLTVGIGTSGAIYGAGAAATTAQTGIAGGTALYVSSGTNSRNFTIDLNTVGAKLYGGGGGGVTGGTGQSQTITCTRKDENPGPGINQQGEVVQRAQGTHSVTTASPATRTAQVLPHNVYGPFEQFSQGNVPGFPGWEYARDWNRRTFDYCQRQYGRESWSADGGGGPGAYNVMQWSDPDPPPKAPNNVRTNPENPQSGPDYVQGSLRFNCYQPARRNQPYTVYRTVTYVRQRNETQDITSPGGLGGTGGKGQGYQRAFTEGAPGSNAIQANCSDLDSLAYLAQVGVSSYNPGSTSEPRTGKKGTSGGDWGANGGTSTDENGVVEYIGGLAGYAIEVADSGIAIEILGNDDPNDPNNPLKGRNNVE